MFEQLKNSMLEDVVSEVAETEGFSLRSPLCQRHGSYEIVFQRTDNAHRFLVLGISPQTDHYRTELYAIAEDDLHAQRELSASFSVPSERFPSWIQGAAFSQALADAFQAAKVLRPSEIKYNLVFAQKPTAVVSANL